LRFLMEFESPVLRPGLAGGASCSTQDDTYDFCLRARGFRCIGFQVRQRHGPRDGRCGGVVAGPVIAEETVLGFREFRYVERFAGGTHGRGDRIHRCRRNMRVLASPQIQQGSSQLRNAIEQSGAEGSRCDAASVERNAAGQRFERRGKERDAPTHAEAGGGHRQVAARLFRVGVGRFDVGLKAFGLHLLHVADAFFDIGLHVACFKAGLGAMEQLRRNGEIALFRETIRHFADVCVDAENFREYQEGSARGVRGLRHIGAHLRTVTNGDLDPLGFNVHNYSLADSFLKGRKIIASRYNGKTVTIEEDIDRLNANAEDNFRRWVVSAGLPADPQQQLTPEQVRQLLTGMPPPLPDDLDATIEKIIAAYIAAEDSVRDGWRERLSTYGRKRLLRFASDMAVNAVTLDSAACIELGLAAVAMEGGRQDFRDSLLPVAKLYHSARKLNLDVAFLFARAVVLTLHGHLRNELKRFPSRPEGERSLAAFEVGTGDDFHYERLP